MSTTILGNNAAPQYLYTYYEVEVDDDEFETMLGEYYDEDSTMGYRATVPKNSASTTVQLVYYYKAATSSFMLDYYWGEDFTPIVPLVFACNSNGAITELLNNSVSQVVVAGRSTGWITMNITLKRKLVKNEKIFFGIYGDIYSYALSSLTPVNHNTQFNYCSTPRHQFPNPVAYVSSAQYIANNHFVDGDLEACIYLQYENAVESVAYTRSVGGTVGAASSNTRKAGWKRTLNQSGAIASSLSRKSSYKKSCSSSGMFTSSGFRGLHNSRGALSSSRLSDSSSRKIAMARRFENTGGITDTSLRSLFKRIVTEEDISFLDSLHQMLLIIRSCFSVSGITDEASRIADYKKDIPSTVENLESVERSGENYRSFEDSAELDSLPFASRLFFRACETVAGFWDWIRGKIREANNVVSFFCPIDLEIELECKL